jgi:predicted phosphate transport protein (TIGR00153 family)
MAFNWIPKEEKFFDFFELQADRIQEVARVFRELVTHWDLNSPLIEKLQELEHEADRTTHEVIDKLNRTFITPFDREDIHELTSKMDDVIDLIQGTASRMHRYRLTQSTEELVRLADILHQTTETLGKAIVGLREIKKPQKMLSYCVEINKFENSGDLMMDIAMEKLFANEKDPIELIKWKEIYEMTEGAIDKCEDVANSIEAIVVKNG